MPNKTIFRIISILFAMLACASLNWAQTKNNIVVNPDFEEGTSGWSERRCTMTVITNPVFSGSQALLISNRTKPFGGQEQVLTDSLVKYGQGKYILSAYYRTTNRQDSAKMVIRVIENGEKTNYQLFDSIGPEDWTHILDTLRISWNDSPSDVSLFHQTKNDSALNYYVDNISIIPDSVYGGIDPGDTTNVPPDDPIYPQEYVQMLGQGFDASWTKSDNHLENYSEELLKEIGAKGFEHIRLRTNWESAAQYINAVTPIVNDCLNNNIIPILAYGGKPLEETPDSTNRAEFRNWWRTVAEHFKSYSHKLAFNLLIEISGELADMPDTLNSIYENTVSVIRETNQTRLIIIGPRNLSNPFYLHELEIPSQANGFLFWEWHFYAAGPSKVNESKLWTTGRPEERKLITDKIEAALAWEDETDLPSWVGAWMPGNYNHGDDYTIQEQVVFASFMVRELEKAGIPWAVNAVHQFHRYWEGYDYWYDFMKPVRDVITDPWKVTLYAEDGYKGESIRLAPGAYDKPFLEDAGFLNSFRSVMIPLDYKITVYSDSGFTGEESAFTVTDSCILSENNTVRVASIKIEQVVTSIEHERELVPSNFLLLNNYPNPFNPSTKIVFNLPGAGTASLMIYNINGRLVKTIFDGRMQAGAHEIEWYGTSNTLQPAASGLYIAILRTQNDYKSIKLMLIR